MNPYLIAYLLTGLLILAVLAVALHPRSPRPFVDRDPAWDCADEADAMYPPEETP